MMERNAAKVKIRGVWQDAACCDEHGMGIALNVDFDNSAVIFVYLDSKADDPLFTDIFSGKCDVQPKTDGDRVYWETGASLTVPEIMDMLQTERQSRATG
ncbi:hypothetical protein FACS1894191_4240 [Clostridia bacterium]|nr:hypothetical protein FACS1894191_4240 [Clostridia bacterium]